MMHGTTRTAGGIFRNMLKKRRGFAINADGGGGLRRTRRKKRALILISAPGEYQNSVRRSSASAGVQPSVQTVFSDVLSGRSPSYVNGMTAESIAVPCPSDAVT